MAEVKTNWILELIDKVTAPMRQVNNSADTVGETVKNVTEALHKMDDAGKQTAKQALSDHKNLTQQIVKEEKEIKRLKALMDSIDSKDPLATGHIELDIKEAQTKIRRYKEQLGEVEHELKEVSKQPNGKKMAANWTEAAVAANQMMEVVKKLGDELSFAQEIKDIERDVQLMTGAVGGQLDRLTHKAYQLQNAFGDSGTQITQAANAMSKHMNISVEEAFDLIEKGYKSGANLNGDMVDQLREYSSQLGQMGIDGAQAIALMAHAGKEGIFNDKAIDSLKEANLSLREMGAPQIEALKQIGLAAKDFAGKTTLEAVQMISKAMDGKSLQAQQLVLTDIFKGAGEDAGLGFIQGFNTVDLDVSKLPSVERAGSGIRSFLADMRLWFSDSMGGIGITMQQLSTPIMTIAGLIPILQTLKKVTWLASIATKAMAAGQWLLNAAMNANPIIWVVTLIAGLIAAVVWAYNEFDEFRAVIAGLGATFMKVFDSIWRYIKLVMTPIRLIVGFVTDGVDGFNAAKDAIAADAVALKNNVVDIATGDAFMEGYDKSMAKSAAKKDKEAAADKTGIGTVDNTANKPVLDGKITDPSAQKAAGLSIDGSGGGGGSKSITMNLTLNNHFKDIKSSLDVNKIAKQLSDTVVDRIKDTLVIA